jgi:hypothetical protein
MDRDKQRTSEKSPNLRILQRMELKNETDQLNRLKHFSEQTQKQHWKTKS